jgi:tetratricopeptide (TPR) repeat protein
MYLTEGFWAVPGPTFTELVGRLIEAMGQSLEALKRTDEEILLRTSDGFLYAFLEDPNRVSLAQIERLLGEVREQPARLAVLTPGRLPLALTAELLRHQSTVVDSERFHELARGFGLGGYLGEEPTKPVARPAPRLLPSARQMDEVMVRGRTWMEWGVPALALRFYRQASQLKPEFLPAKTGIGRALAQLGLWEDAGRVFDEILALHPDDLDARLGKAALLGSMGNVPEEIAAYQALRDESPRRLDIRTHLIAALLDAKDWSAARSEIEGVLGVSPEDPQMRFLYSVALEHTGTPVEAQRERERARSLGLTPMREASLCAHLGLPAPPAAEASKTAELVPSPSPSAPAKGSRPAKTPSPGARPPKVPRGTSTPAKGVGRRVRKPK